MPDREGALIHDRFRCAPFLLALLLAVAVGTLGGMEAQLLGVRLHAVYAFIGDLFLNALKMLIVPLVVSAIISGISSIGDGAGLGRIGAKTLIYYLSTSLLAILSGLLFVNLIQPGVESGIVLPTGETGAVAAAVEGRGMGDLVIILQHFFPPNIIAAAAEGQMLGLITFSLLFGLFMTRIKKEAGDVLQAFWQGIFEVMMRITALVLRFAPLGIFALVAKVVAEAGLDAFRPLS
ncbi:MAG: cation:dicarboxylase symporter family transporter [Gammaproteobacteria bacterium]|nr:cation:dicarboxylase symporter family transporter [Gammaproteobacteria bacterium]